MLCKRCGGSGGLLRKNEKTAGKLKVVTCSTCGGIGTRHHPSEFYKEKKKHLIELDKNKC